MDLLKHAVDLFLHLDKYLNVVIQRYDAWTYLILFAVVFCETGLVVTPLLPGDSLLFAAGAFSATGSLNVWWVFLILTVAAILGDAVNYSVGRALGPKVFQENARFFKKEYLLQTEAFYERHGPKTIVMARFVPIVRTFAPFVAGIGRMNYAKFSSYNVLGAILWSAVCVFAGFFFGNIPIVKNNFSLVILAIIVIAILPAIVEFMKRRRTAARQAT